MRARPSHLLGKPESELTPAEHLQEARFYKASIRNSSGDPIHKMYSEQMVRRRVRLAREGWRRRPEGPTLTDTENAASSVSPTA